MISRAKETQKKEILDYMLENGSITQREAVNMGCYRLSARIWDLRHDGVPIISSLEEVTKANGKKTHIARYAIVRPSTTAEVM